ncbi:MAG: MBL fold metallo-hydrolase [Syntrophales bacterium]|nr:MBL fold metallo-hydrolase [Syntrophales bacterium]
MRVTIIYDNEASREDLRADWGFSCLVEAHGRRILFDTGAKGDILLGNMKKLDIEPTSIDDVFISHADWDHMDGLEGFLKENSDITLYIPPSYHTPPDSVSEVIVVEGPTEIHEGIFSTGELGGIEQALIVTTEKGPVIITGCSHPGVGDILEAASTHGKVYALIGGLHGSKEFERLEGIDVVCATHCTEFKAQIAALYPDTCIEGGAGRIIDI